MKNNIRIISALLALVILSLAFVSDIVIPVCATQEELSLCDCDTLYGWTKTGGNSLKALLVPARSQGSKGAIECDVDKGAFRNATYTLDGVIDISGYGYIEWDAMFFASGDTTGKMWDEVKAAYGTSGNNTLLLKLMSDGSDDDRVIWRLSQIEHSQPYANRNWVHFKAPIKNPNTEINFDAKRLKKFYFASCDGATVNSVSNGQIRIDNIKVTGTATDIPSTVVINNCENIGGWETESPQNADLKIASGRGKDGTNAVFAAGGCGALRKLTYTLPVPVEISGYSSFEWDMQSVINSNDTIVKGNDLFANICAAYGEYMALELSDGIRTARIHLDSWQIGGVGADKYRHFAVSFKNAVSGITHLTSVSLYVLPLGIDAVDKTVPNAFFRFDNLLITNNSVIPNSNEYRKTSEILLEDCDDKDGWTLNDKAESGNMTVNSNGFTGNAIQAFGTKGAVFPLKYTFATPISVYSHGFICFDIRFLKAGGADDMWSVISEKYSDSIRITLADSNGNLCNYYLSDIDIKSSGNGWYKFTISLNRALYSKIIDLSEVKSFEISISTSEDTSVQSNVNMRIDNIKALPKNDFTVGDVNGDGYVTVKDFVRFKKFFGGQEVEVFEEFANVDKSVDIDSTDYENVKKILLGYEVAIKSYFLLSDFGWSSVVKP